MSGKTGQPRKVWTFKGNEHHGWWTPDPHLMRQEVGTHLYDPGAKGSQWYVFTRNDIGTEWWAPVYNMETVPSEYRTKLLLLT